MRPLTEDDVRASFVNADDDELRTRSPCRATSCSPTGTTSTSSRGAIRAPAAAATSSPRSTASRTGVVLRAADGTSRARSAMCNLCHTMQPADQVSLFTARKAGEAGAHGDSVGTYICADLSCHENVRLAAPARAERGAGERRPHDRRHAAARRGLRRVACSRRRGAGV